MSYRLPHVLLLAVVSATGALSGCVQQPTEPTLAEQYPESQQLELLNYLPVNADLYAEGKPASKEVLRTGRYTLLSTSAQAGQSNLMEQIIQVRIPTRLNPTVGDGLAYTLDRSGYQLCSITGQAVVETLFSRPLPAAHYELGPMPLREALQLLSGPSYQLQVEPVTREVCFSLRVARGDQTAGTPSSGSSDSTVHITPVINAPSLLGGQP